MRARRLAAAQGPSLALPRRHARPITRPRARCLLDAVRAHLDAGNDDARVDVMVALLGASAA